MNTLFYTLGRVKRLFHTLADVFLVEGAWGCLRDVWGAYGAVADIDSLGAVFTGGGMVGSCFAW